MADDWMPHSPWSLPGNDGINSLLVAEVNHHGDGEADADHAIIMDTIEIDPSFIMFDGSLGIPSPTQAMMSSTIPALLAEPYSAALSLPTNNVSLQSSIPTATASSHSSTMAFGAPLYLPQSTRIVAW